MDSIILIDLSAIFWRFWHASENEEISSAKRKTVSLVEELIRDHKYCAVCTDVPPYIRSEWFPDYKKGREHPPLSVEELRNTVRELKAIGIPYYGCKGYEADDIIYTLSKLAISEGLSVFIAATDKDLLQISGVKITEPFTRTTISSEDKFGCPPELVRDVLSLSGDTSDNVPGVPGIGPKKALQVIDIIGDVSKFLSISHEERGAFYVEMPEAMAKNICDNIELLRISHKLVTLLEAPVKLTLGEAKKQLEESQDLQPQPATEAIDTVEKPVEITSTQAIVTTTKSEVAIKSDSRNANWALSLEPDNLNAAWNMSKILFDSRMFGQFPNAQSVLAIIMRGRSLGMDATTALSNFHVIEGKPAMHASLIVGLVLESKKAEYFELVESTEKLSVWATKRIGRNEIRMEYTIEEATQAGLLRPSRSGKPSNWQTRPKTMLRWRAATELARAVYPEVTTGLYTPDEIEESE
jgi:5'-3' exonuclease